MEKETWEILVPKFIEGLYDSNAEISHNIWMIGGTRITNFSIEKLPKYKKAIAAYKKINPKVNLTISKFAYEPNGTPLSNSYSLHCIGECGSLSEFWIIFDGNEKVKNKK